MLLIVGFEIINKNNYIATMDTLIFVVDIVLTKYNFVILYLYSNKKNIHSILLVLLR